MSKTNSLGNSERLITIHKRKLPHWEWQGSTYFLTFSTIPGIILIDNEKDIALSTIRFFANQRYTLYSCVVMETHIHCILQPFKNKDAISSSEIIAPTFSNTSYSLSQITHSIKSYSSHKINAERHRKGKIWLTETYDRILRDENEFLEKLQYILDNPVKAGIVEKPEDYKWLFVEILTDS
jgi:REP element-mobilizing transposase RayT